MLKAVLHGKAGLIEHEDLMTAAVFGCSSYLSPKVKNHLMYQWLGITEDCSNFEHIEFWLTYQLNDEKK
jgi:hypothetical protein